MPDTWGLKLATPLFEKLTVIGCGLIGSSLLRVARRNNLARLLVAADISPAVCARVDELGLADGATSDLAVAVVGADLVILCVPVGANERVGKAIGPTLARGAIVSDVGSVNLVAFGVVIAMTLVTAPLGARLAHAMNPVPLKRVFAVFLTLVALNMLRKALGW